MQYQVVVKTVVPVRAWTYYPYWAPTSDREAAIRLARYAAQAGYEAAIAQAPTSDTLREITQSVLRGHDSQLVPALRFSPDGSARNVAARHEQVAQDGLNAPSAVDASALSRDQTWLDRRRIALESGPGGDLLAQPGWQTQPITFPQRMDVLVRWLALRRRVLSEALGGPTDGGTGA